MKTPLRDAQTQSARDRQSNHCEDVLPMAPTPCARGRQLWLAEDFGRHNLTRDFIEQRAEARLGAAPWQEPLYP